VNITPVLRLIGYLGSSALIVGPNSIIGSAAPAAHHKPAKDASAIIRTPIRRVAVAMLIAKGFVSATKTIKMPRRIMITAQRKTALLVSRLILFSNGTQWWSCVLTGQDLGRRARR
jgi:hypothetical protein